MSDLFSHKKLPIDERVGQQLFCKLKEFQSGWMEKIQKRIKAELKIVESPEILCSLLPIEKISDSKFFFPVHPDYLKEVPLEKILQYLSKENFKPFYSSIVYVNRSEEQINRLIEEDKTYEGRILDGSECEYRFSFKFHKNQKHVEAESDLYESFNKNDVEWVTVNNPHSKKMFDVLITEVLDSTVNIESIQSINYGLENDFLFNHVPVWNVKTELFKERYEQQTVRPFKTRKFYGYKLPKDFFNRTPPLIDSKDIEISAVFVDNEEKQIEVLSEKCLRQVAWQIYSFSIPDDEELRKFKDSLKFPVFSNAKIDFIAGRSRFWLPRTMGAITEVLKSYCDIFERFDVKSISLHDHLENRLSRCDLNHFLPKNIFSDTQRKTLQIFLVCRKKRDSYTEDLLNFLYSELSLKFPEFKVVLECDL